jgi:hypothetical protein
MRAALALVALLCAPVAAEPRDAVDTLPELATISKHRVKVVVRGHVVAAKRKEMVKLVEHVIADVERRFLVTKGDAHKPITLALFSDPKRYMTIAEEFGDSPSSWGFYMPSNRIALANIGASVGNLRHELAHPLIDDDFPTAPAWLDEGLGSLYGTARWTGDRFEFLVNYRLQDLQAALKANKLPSLDKLARTTYNDVHSNDAMMYYAYARYVLLYLDRKGTLSAFYADMRASKNVDAQAKLVAKYVDEPAFRAWAKTLKR